MLTEKEKRWLEFRKNVCFRCKKRRQTCSLQLRDDCLKVGYPIRDLAMMFQPDYADAAEFEARVAARLAGAWAIGEDMCFNNHCQLFDKDRCTACYLKNARIAVEEEMENERNHS